jgi:hypothetical protein
VEAQILEAPDAFLCGHRFPDRLQAVRWAEVTRAIWKRVIAKPEINGGRRLPYSFGHPRKERPSRIVTTIKTLSQMVPEALLRNLAQFVP